MPPDKVVALYNQLLADGFFSQAGKKYGPGNCADCTQADLTLTGWMASLKRSP